MVCFKHCYYPEAYEWGVLGLAKQRASTALKIYKQSPTILLAQTKEMGGVCSGKIFAICTILSLSGSTKELGSPDVIQPDDSTQWTECLVIGKYWHVDPIEYADFGEEVAAQARKNRGKLFRIEDDMAVQDWLATAIRTEELKVYQSQKTRDYLDRWKLGAPQHQA